MFINFEETDSQFLVKSLLSIKAVSIYKVRTQDLMVFSIILCQKGILLYIIEIKQFNQTNMEILFFNANKLL